MRLLNFLGLTFISFYFHFQNLNAMTTIASKSVETTQNMCSPYLVIKSMQTDVIVDQYVTTNSHFLYICKYKAIKKNCSEV